MNEIVLNNKKNGMAVLLLTILLYLAGIALMILGGIYGIDGGRGWMIPFFVLGVIWVGIGWIPLLGLKVLKYTDYGFLVPTGSYKVVLNTDSKDFGGNGFADDTVTHFTNYDPLYVADHKEWLKLYIPARSAVVLKKI